MPVVVTEDYEILRDVVRRLDSIGIPYMLTGSIAMNYYAQPRLSRDFDIVVEMAGKDAGKVVDLFDDSFYVSKEAVVDAIRRSSLFNIIDFDTSVKVDMISADHRDPYQRSAMSRRKRLELLPGLALDVISCEDLVLSKAAFAVSEPWSRDDPSSKQLDDVANLLDSCTDLDSAYVLKWARELGVEGVLRKAADHVA